LSNFLHVAAAIMSLPPTSLQFSIIHSLPTIRRDIFWASRRHWMYYAIKLLWYVWRYIFWVISV